MAWPTLVKVRTEGDVFYGRCYKARTIALTSGIENISLFVKFSRDILERGKLPHDLKNAKGGSDDKIPENSILNSSASIQLKMLKKLQLKLDNHLKKPGALSEHLHNNIVI